MEEENQKLDERLEEIKRQSLEELENMERIISENEKIKAEIADKAEQSVRENVESRKSGRLTTVIFVFALAVICSLSLVSINILKPLREYNRASELMDKKQYDTAMEAFEKLEDYKNSTDMIKECKYRKAEDLMLQGKSGLAISQLNEIRAYKDSADRINEFIGSGDGIIAVGDRHSVAINSIGRVIAAGDNSLGQCDVGEWNGITAVAAGSNHTIALCADGSVVAAGSNGYGQCNVQNWHNIVYIAAAGNTSYGVREDGSVVAAGDNARGQCDVENDRFTKVTKVVCGGEYAIALKSDGTLALAGNTVKLEKAEDWTDIKDISALSFTVCAVKNDGTVLVCGDINNDITGEWTNIKYAAAGYCYVVAINDKGELMSTTDLADGIIAAMKDALRIECGVSHILALKSNGTVSPIGQNKYGECDVTGWRDIMIK